MCSFVSATAVTAAAEAPAATTAAVKALESPAATMAMPKLFQVLPVIWIALKATLLGAQAAMLSLPATARVAMVATAAAVQAWMRQVAAAVVMRKQGVALQVVTKTSKGTALGVQASRLSLQVAAVLPLVTLTSSKTGL